jgi:hypothetical protein
MKKIVLLSSFVLMCLSSFANSNDLKLVENKAIESNEAVNVFDDCLVCDYSLKISDVDGGCVVSCYANIYYYGALVTTVYASGSGYDCISAQENCLEEANRKALSFIDTMAPLEP